MTRDRDHHRPHEVFEAGVGCLSLAWGFYVEEDVKSDGHCHNLRSRVAACCDRFQGLRSKMMVP